MKTIKHNHQGFTLIELLAIIVILAVIMAIAIPQVLNVVNGSKESAWKDNVKMITKAIELNTQLYDAETGAYTYTMTGLCASPSTVNEISKADDTTITCSSNVFTLTGTGQFSGKSATIDCSRGNCNTTFTEGGVAVETCPGAACRYLYVQNQGFSYGDEYSTYFETSDTKANYYDVISASGKNVFLGGILSDGDHGTIEKGFVCGIHNDTPFCAELKHDGNQYTTNTELLYDLFGTYDENTHLGCYDDGYELVCAGSVDVNLRYSDGWLQVHDYDNEVYCDLIERVGYYRLGCAYEW